VKIEGIEANGVSTPIMLGDNREIRSGFSVEKREADSVQVVWYIIEDLKWYPWEKFYGMMAEKMKGPLMQQSLDDLKAYLEAKQKRQP
jgi:L-rhamnose isomerase